MLWFQFRLGLSDCYVTCVLITLALVLARLPSLGSGCIHCINMSKCMLDGAMTFEV
jgi:hypothetical protein